MSSTLHDFTDVESPKIIEKKWVHHPIRKNSILGSLGECNRGHPCFTAQRTRWKEGNDVQDYYRKIGGYSLVEKTLNALIDRGVKTMFIEEKDNSRFVEYETVAFAQQGESLPDWQGEQQVCCPVEHATNTWEVSEVNISRMKR